MNSEKLEEGLGYNFNRAYVVLRREFVRSLAEYNISPEQWHVMIALFSAGHPLNQREIVRLTLKDKPTISRMIKRLEKNGWIEKKVSQLNGSITIIQPTKEGMKLKKEVPRKLDACNKPFMEELGEEDKQTMLRILKKIRYFFGDLS